MNIKYKYLPPPKEKKSFKKPEENWKEARNYRELKTELNPGTSFKSFNNLAPSIF